MEFCDDCGSMMKAEEEAWICSSCGNRQLKNPEANYTLKEDQEASDVIEVDGDDDAGRPTTEVNCPECENDRAYYYMQQIRAADESETRFFVCTDCEHKWREDDH